MIKRWLRQISSFIDCKMGVGQGMGIPILLLGLVVLLYAVASFGPLVYPPFWDSVFEIERQIGLWLQQ